MATKTQLTADQKVRIVAAILKLQNGHPTDKANNPYRFIRYREVAKEIAMRDIATPTLRNILVSLSIEPRSSGKVRPASERCSTATINKNIDDLKDRLSVYGGHLARIEEKLDSLITQLRE